MRSQTREPTKLEKRGPATRSDDVANIIYNANHIRPDYSCTCILHLAMSIVGRLSDAQVILLAAHYISDVDVESFHVLAAEKRDVLTDDAVYQLLLTLYPSDHTARSALLALLGNIESNFSNASALDHDLDTSFIAKTSTSAAAERVKSLGIVQDEDDEQQTYGTHGLGKFIIQWAYRIESEEGALEDLIPLLEEFSQRDSTLNGWALRYFSPLYRLQYHFYPEEAEDLTLRGIESLRGGPGLDILLQYAQKQSGNAAVARDLDQIIAPWIGTRQMDGHAPSEDTITATWQDVFDWLLTACRKDFQLAAKALLEWDGPPEATHEMLLDYCRTALAVLYANEQASYEILQLSQRILRRASDIAHSEMTPMDIEMPDIAELISGLPAASEGDLLPHMLLLPNNPLTSVSGASLEFLLGVITTMKILMGYKIMHSIPDIARVCLFGTAERQKLELMRVLQQIPRLTTSRSDWLSTRQHLCWLRTWRRPDHQDQRQISGVAFLGHLEEEFVEHEILKSMLSSGKYEDVKKIYITAGSSPIAVKTVEDEVVAAIYSAYDNASNGNRTRGGMRRASDMLTTFNPAFSNSPRLRDVESLLKATHGLSFYQLTLQHDVPFRPVNIRASRDPLSLIGRVLEQDHKAYTKVDDLLDIGRNLVLSRLTDQSIEPSEGEQLHTEIDEASQRITYLAITAALAANDFDTAYSYITTRLSTSPSDQAPANAVDDVTWRAVYAAGKYRPSHSPKSLHDRIAGLSKRMDLLALALTLAPKAEALSEILAQWRRSEEEMDRLRSQALEEERAFDRGDDTVPGAFGMEESEHDAAETKRALAKRSLINSSATYEEEAPMGLFDVARGAASALRRNAFPLNAGSGRDMKIRDNGSIPSSMGSRPLSPDDDGTGRVRKRDMVSNMVTSGLVSGMGWVLGAQTPDQGRDDME